MNPIRIARLIAAAAALFLNACVSVPGDNEHQTSPRLQFANVHAEPLPMRIRRVAMLPVYTTQNYTEAQRDLDSTFRGELSKMLRFEVVSVSRPELSAIVHDEQIASTEQIPGELIAVLRQKFGADAVLFTDLTQYRPYRPIAVGIRAKLVDLASLRVIWSADAIIDSANSQMAEAARIYADVPQPSRFSPGSDVILQSPRRFSAFAAHQVFSTLPPR